MKNIIVLITLSFSILSCKTYNEQELANFDQTIQKYIQKNKLHLKKSNSGLYYKVDKKGEGNFVQITDSVSFTYTGKLLNGTIVDQQKSPITFKVTELISCWKEVLLSNKEGAEITLISPPQLAYGNHKLDAIPQNSILLFNLTFNKVH